MMITKHFIKLNICSKGYCLYIKENNKFQEHDLNVHNEYVPYNYISIQNHIEKILLSFKLPVSLSFNFDNSTNKLMVGFGLFLNIADDMGREGIVYIHAVEINGINHLYSIVLHFIKVLSPTSIKEFYFKKLYELANEGTNVSSILNNLCNKLEENKFVQKNESIFLKMNHDFSKIIHDCAGGSSIAWLTFAELLNNKKIKWEVFDDIETSGKLSTQLNPLINNESIYTSELFQISIENRKILSNKGTITNNIKEVPITNENCKEADIENTSVLEVIEETSKKKKKYAINIKTYLIILLSIIFLIFLIVNRLAINSLKYNFVELQVLIKKDKHQIEILDSMIKNKKADNDKFLQKQNNFIKSQNAQLFINNLLLSIKGSGSKLTKDELKAAKQHIDTSDIKTIKIITNLIDNFDIYDSDKSSKLDSKEIIDLIGLHE